MMPFLYLKGIFGEKNKSSGGDEEYVTKVI